jgi:polysaccharide biosynthesis transport protein
MEVKDLLAILWKRRAIVIAMLVLVTGLSALFASSRPQLYESTSTIALTPRIEEGTFLAPDTLDSLLGTYAQTAKSSVTLRRAEDVLGGPLPGQVDTSTEAGTGILRIIGQAEDPEAAALSARAVTNAFIASIEEGNPLDPQVVDPAVPADTPIQPRPPLIIGVGILLGLLSGALLAFAVDQFRRRIETSADVAEFTPAPVVGRLPRHRALARHGPALVWDSARLASLHEAFRALRTNVEVLTKDGGTVIQVTSPLAEQGKSTMVANLGVALAQVGIETLIVDADLRRPTLHKVFGLDNSRGLSTMMALPGSPTTALATHYPGLSIVPSGPIPPNSTEMLHIRFSAVLDELRQSAGIVLVDSPPVLPVSDARLIASHVDGVLLVVAAGAQKPAAFRSTIERIEFAGGRLLGVVLNQAEGSSEDRGYDYYRAYSRADEPAPDQRPPDEPPADEPPRESPTLAS